MNEALAVAAAYLLGSIPFAFLAGRVHGVDLREVGSGNLGAANVFRALGKGLGIAVMAADIGKGVAAVLIARALTDDPWPAIAAGAAVAGHVFPAWMGFKGGKGVAVGGGAVVGLMPLASLILLPFWLIVVLISRFTSLGSILGAVAATPVVWALGYSTSNVVFTAIASAAVLLLHRGNIVRLIQHRENRIDLRGGGARQNPGAQS